MNANQIATDLWDSYLKAKVDPIRLQKTYWRFDRQNHGDEQEHICLSRIDDFSRAYKNMCSLRNSAVSNIGNVGNQLLADAYESCGCRVKREVSLEDGTGRRNIDLVLPDRNVYLSVTTTPRERKRGDWQRELQLLIARQQTGQINPFVFIGFMYEGSNKKLDKAKEEARRINKELRRTWPNATVVLAQNIDQHSAFIDQYVLKSPSFAVA